MNLNERVSQMMPDLVRGLAHCSTCPFGANTAKGLHLAGQRAVLDVLDRLVAVLFPGCHGLDPERHDWLRNSLEEELRITAATLREQVRHAFEYECTIRECDDCDKCGEKADDAVADLLRELPGVQRLIQEDILAAYEGDPAAPSTMEVVMSYPGLQAIVTHRIAHILCKGKVPLIPRIMSEQAHSRTGIDIHPGAEIGPGFFIDHGTGVVIGETCSIGKNVKLYQGVTLGALSFEKDEEGRLIKGIKRHPDVGDNVVIYAGATILGGDTVIGHGSVIGGNVWLTHSVPAGSVVYNAQPTPLVRQADGTWKKADGPWDDFGAGI